MLQARDQVMMINPEDQDEEKTDNPRQEYRGEPHQRVPDFRFAAEARWKLNFQNEQGDNKGQNAIGKGLKSILGNSSSPENRITPVLRNRHGLPCLRAPAAFVCAQWSARALLTAPPCEIIDCPNGKVNAGLAGPKLRATFADLGGTVLPGSPKLATSED
jgi:hypothetical protein